MKAISLWQPWASAIPLGLKKIETRSWDTRLRGTIAIHAAKRWTEDERSWALHFSRLYGRPELADPPRGAIIATARLVATFPTEALTGDITEMERAFGNYGADRFGWMLEDVVPLATPIPYRGLQGLFEIPASVIS